MPAPTNLSFETVGGSPGLAASWTATFTSTAEEYASFGTDDGTEGFDEWVAGALFAFAPGDISFGQVGSLYVTPKYVENFEELWLGNEGDLFELALAESAVIDGGAAEGFEGVSWNGGLALLTAFVGYGADLSTPTPEGFESTTWNGGVALKTSFVGVGTDLGAMAVGTLAGSVAVEGFEDVRAGLPTYADVTISLLHTAAHPYANGDSVFLSGATLPAPLGAGVEYFARDVTAGVSLRVAETLGGAAISLTTTGSVDLVVAGDPRLCWAAKMGTL